MKGVNVNEMQVDLSLKTISGEQSLKNSMSFQKRVEEIIANNPHFNNPDYEGVNPYYNGNENLNRRPPEYRGPLCQLKCPCGRRVQR